MRAVRVNSGTVARRWPRALTRIRGLEVGGGVGQSLASSSPADRPHYHSGIFFLVIEVFEPVTFNNALGFDLQPKKSLSSIRGLQNQKPNRSTKSRD